MHADPRTLPGPEQAYAPDAVLQSLPKHELHDTLKCLINSMAASQVFVRVCLGEGVRVYESRGGRQHVIWLECESKVSL